MSEMNVPVDFEDPAAVAEAASEAGTKVCLLHSKKTHSRFYLQNASSHWVETERCSRVRGEAADQHRAHVSCLSHSCQRAKEPNRSLSVTAAIAVTAVPSRIHVASVAVAVCDCSFTKFICPVLISLYNAIFENVVVNV